MLYAKIDLNWPRGSRDDENVKSLRNNNDDNNVKDDRLRTNFDQKSSLEPSAKVSLK